MATEVLMPKLGLTMTEGTIEEWKFKEVCHSYGWWYFSTHRCSNAWTTYWKVLKR